MYHAFPRAGGGMLGKVHFWLHTIRTPFVLVGMFLYATGQDDLGFAPALGGALTVMVGTLVFLNDEIRQKKTPRRMQMN